MSSLYTPHTFTKESRQEAIKTLLDNITPDRDFYLLLIGAALLAIGGIFLDSIPVLIASMVVAPLAYPILGLGLGIASGDSRLVGRSLIIVITALIIAFSLAVLVTMVFGSIRVDNTFISFTSNKYLATSISIVAGAIAVSLMPPLVATGIELTSNKLALAEGAFILFLLNVAGILISSTFVFAVLHVGREYRNMHKAR